MSASIKVAVLADTSDLVVNVGKAESSLEGLEATAKGSAAGIDNAMGGVADSADNVASKGAKAAGALSGLGGLAADQLGFPALGNSMMVAGTAAQTLADSGDLLNLVTQSTIVKNVALKVSTIATAAAQKTAAVAQWALNAAMSANPIGLVVVAIGALAVGLVLAYKKSETFRKIVDAAFTKVKNVAMGAFDWIKKNWPLLLAIITGPIGLAVLAVVKNWDKIKAGATAVKDWISDKFNAVVGFFTKMPSRISKAAGGLFDGIKDAFKSAINWIIDKWNNLAFSVPSIDTHIPGIGKVGGFELGTPNIPRLATGGRADRPSLVVIGDGREPESVLPDSMMERALARAAAAGGGGGLTINVGTVQAHDYRDFRRQMTNAARAAQLDGVRTQLGGSPAW